MTYTWKLQENAVSDADCEALCDFIRDTPRFTQWEQVAAFEREFAAWQGARYAVFVCPILSGSGVRVKLLEAFAAGIPAVSTFIGAEGLASRDGEFCLLADSPAEFAARVLALFENPEQGAEMATRARAEVEANWDMAAITGKLVESYGEMVRENRQ